MAGKSRFAISESKIKKFFSEGRNVYSETELHEILDEKKNLWNLPGSMTGKKFIEKLVDREVLSRREVVFTGYLQSKTRYLKTGAGVFDYALSLTKKAYLSHYSAAFLLGLTTQVPKTVFVTSEQSEKARGTDVVLQQQNIDSAFKKPQRISSVQGKFDDYTIMFHNGKYSNRLGVFTNNGLSYTNIERTLIDLTVRPMYGGGVQRVLEIFENSIDKVSINKLRASLEKLNFIYPYHQALGFYLEKAGLDEKRLSTFLQYEKPNKFYLTYDMKEVEYNEKWRIFIPKGI